MKHCDFPCLIIGAGPAGISAATWLSSFNVPYYWVSKPDTFGGTLRRVHNAIANFPPHSYSDGQHLIEQLRQSLQNLNIASPNSDSVSDITVADNICNISLISGQHLTTHTVIIATGTQYRRLGVPGESEGLGKWISQSATADASKVTNQKVAVVGGGDAAFENALILAQHGCQVYLLLRSTKIGARPAFVKQVSEHPNIQLYPIPVIITSIDEQTHGCRLYLQNREGIDTLDVACLFIRIGVEPHLPEIAPFLRMDDGFLVVDSRQRTSQPQIFAAGDITTDHLRCVATATGQGANAARSAAEYLGFI